MCQVITFFPAPDYLFHQIRHDAVKLPLTNTTSIAAVDAKSSALLVFDRMPTLTAKTAV
jgi:hypothetical protein